MAAQILTIIDSAYRATLEEQDDTVIWFSLALKAAGAHSDVLLRGNAVNYAVLGQDASGLSFGGRRQTQPPRIDQDIAKLVEKGSRVFAVADDLAERGIETSELLPAVSTLHRSDLPALFDSYARVWLW